MRDRIGDENKMRDRIKNVEFWMRNVPEELLNLQNKIPDVEENYLKHQQSNPINWRTLFYLNYSLGTNLSDCFNYFKKWLSGFADSYKKENGDCFFEITALISICVCYKSRFSELSDDMLRLLDVINTNVKNDCFLNAMIGFFFNKQKCSLQGTEKLKYISRILEKKDISSVKEVLQKDWYKFYKDAYWYNSHKTDVYEGYWAWDLAAAVKILGIDDSGLKDEKYYPYDLVHYEE